MRGWLRYLLPLWKAKSRAGVIFSPLACDFAGARV